MNKMEEDFIRVVRPVKQSMFAFNNFQMKELNIIGVFKVNSRHSTLIKNHFPKKEFPKNDCPAKNRNDGFNILSDRNNVSSHLRKTKFCKIKITTGYCNRAICNFAHNMSEYHFAECAFKNNCKKEGCSFKHPDETIDEYKTRINFKIPFNIC